MRVAWEYVDAFAAAKAALRDYNNMLAIIANTGDEIKEEYNKAFKPRSARLDGIKARGRPAAASGAIDAALDRVDVLRERYARAAEYMEWFAPAWDALTDKEREILEDSYARGVSTESIAARFSYSERQLKRLKHKALKRLSILLYG